MVLCGVRVSATAECQEFSVAMVAAELGGWKKNLWRSLKMLECSGHVSDGGSYVL